MDHISFCDKNNLNKMKNKKQIYLLLSFHSHSEPIDKVFVNDSLYFVDKSGPFNTENRFDVTAVIKEESEILKCLEDIQLKGHSDSLIKLQDSYFKRFGKKSNQMILAEKNNSISRSLSIKWKRVGRQWLIVGNINNLMD